MEERFMLLAIEEAKKALKMSEVPIGAVIVKDGVVVSKAYNIKEKEQLVTKHAEIIVVEKTSLKLNNWRLTGCDMYVTLEPCPMCASAIKQARISNLYYGLNNKDTNNKKVIDSILKKDNTNPGVDVYCGYFETEINNLMSEFFRSKRAKK